MKKVFFIIFVLIIIIGVILFFVFGGKKGVQDILSNQPFFGTFFDVEVPSQNNFTNNPNIPDPVTIDPDQPYIATVLRQISFEPVSGYTSYETISTSTQIIIDENNIETEVSQTSTSTAIRFQERATGHIYDVFEFSPIPKQISNTTVPKIYETIFTTNINEFIYKTLSGDHEQIITQRGILSPVENPQTTGTSTDSVASQSNAEFESKTSLASVELSTFIKDMIYISESNKLIYAIKQPTGTSVFESGTIRNNEKLIRNFPFNDFLISKINQNEVLLTTKPSADALGYAYTLNLGTGAFSKILGDIAGLLMIVNPSKTYSIYSESTQSRPTVRILDIAQDVIYQLPIDTIPSEKCVFSQKNARTAYCFGSLIYTSAKYPDDWYKGKVSNKEELYEIDLETGSIVPTFDFDQEDTTVQFDVINPTLTENDSFIIFQNKKDLTLWRLNLARLSSELF